MVENFSVTCMTFKEMQYLFPIAQRKIKLYIDKSIESCGGNKPEIIEYYNFTKGRVDAMDQMVCYYSIKRMSSKWPMAAMFNKIYI